MKIYGLLIYATPPGSPAIPLSTAWNLTEFGWLQRGTVQDVMAFMAKVSRRYRYQGKRLSTAWLTKLHYHSLSIHHHPPSFQTVAERTPPSQRQSVQENSYVAHVHSRPASEGLSGVLVSDSEYPVRVAFSLLNKLLDEFLLKVPKTSYQSRVNSLSTGGNSADQPAKGEGIVPTGSFPQIKDYVEKYQDPRQADAIMKVQQELDETKIVLVSSSV